MQQQQKRRGLFTTACTPQKILVLSWVCDFSEKVVHWVSLKCKEEYKKSPILSGWIRSFFETWIRHIFQSSTEAKINSQITLLSSFGWTWKESWHQHVQTDSQSFLGPLRFQEQANTTDTEEICWQTELERCLPFLSPLTYLEGLTPWRPLLLCKAPDWITVPWGTLTTDFNENRDNRLCLLHQQLQDQRSTEICVILHLLTYPPANRSSLCTWQAGEERGGGEGDGKGRALNCLPREVHQ